MKTPYTHQASAGVDRERPGQLRLAVNALAEIFNVFSRTNFVAVNDIFGTGAFPASPLPTYGQFTLAVPLRQVQIGLRVGF